MSQRILEGFEGACYQCWFNSREYNDNLANSLLGYQLPSSIVNAVDKRKAEFVVGRFLAKKAIRSLNSVYKLGIENINRIEVYIGENRAPIWPTPLVGSISHTDNYAICAVTQLSDNCFIGIDAERVVSQSTASDIAKHVLVPSEYYLVGNIHMPEPFIFTLIFSAKESLFKALYQYVKHYFDFDVARVTNLDNQNKSFTIELTQSLTNNLMRGKKFKGRYAVLDNSILTYIVK